MARDGDGESAGRQSGDGSCLHAGCGSGDAKCQAARTQPVQGRTRQARNRESIVDGEWRGERPTGRGLKWLDILAKRWTAWTGWLKIRARRNMQSNFKCLMSPTASSCKALLPKAQSLRLTRRKLPNKRV